MLRKLIKALRKVGFLALVSSLLSIFSMGLSACSPVINCQDGGNRSDREEICKSVNTHRLSLGSPLITLDDSLSEIAQSHAGDMDKRNYFSHSSPEGETLSLRLEDRGIQFRMSGENIAYGQNSTESVMSIWMNSKNHRSNILSPSFKKMGVGRSGSIWVQVFTD